MARKQREPKEHRPENRAEGAFFDEAHKAGWSTTKRGWPDFFCWRGDEIMLVEVKRKRGYRLKVRQRQLLEVLASHGIACYQWDPDDGFQQVGRGPAP